MLNARIPKIDIISTFPLYELIKPIADIAIKPKVSDIYFG